MFACAVLTGCGGVNTVPGGSNEPFQLIVGEYHLSITDANGSAAQGEYNLDISNHGNVTGSGVLNGIHTVSVMGTISSNGVVHIVILTSGPPPSGVDLQGHIVNSENGSASGTLYSDVGDYPSPGYPLIALFTPQ
jgi:hypothetical protein